jgi:EAL domain-containing protein (putative c-di-GMP-specific phosphodiesterase class I)
VRLGSEKRSDIATWGGALRHIEVVQQTRKKNPCGLRRIFKPISVSTRLKTASVDIFREKPEVSSMPTFPIYSIVPRLLAVLSALLTGCLCFFAGLAVINSIEHSRVDQVHRDAAGLLAGMASDSLSRLRSAVQVLEPDCSENTLKVLRRWLLASDHISQFGVLDSQGRVICTTTEGVLPSPVTLLPPDIVFENPETHEVFGAYYNRPIGLSEQGLRSAITSLSQFNVVVSPFKVRSLFALGIDVIRVAQPTRELQVTYRSATLSDEVMRQLDMHRLADGNTGYWDMPTSTYLNSSIVPNTRYTIQSATPLTQVLQRYSLLLITLSVVSIVVSALTFLAALPAIRRWFSFESQIRNLLHEDNVVCMLQPIYSLENGKLTGCELLMRLQVGELLVYPDRVIPTVLLQKLTERFDRAVITRASAELEALAFPPGFKIALNFFPETFLSGLARRLLDDKFATLISRGMQVCLEIIEQQVSADIVSEVHELKQQGYLVSVDDFGTGFSNLASVRSLAPHFLKIDRSFVCDMEDSTVRSTLIPEIIQIARAVGAEVVAEGIENRTQLERLKELGAEYGQGYFLGRPQSFSEFAVLLQKSTTENEYR